MGEFAEVTGSLDFYSRQLGQEWYIPQPYAVSLDSAVSEIKHKVKNANRPTIINISGASGSGKSTRLDYIKRVFGGDCTTLSTDDYYIGKTRMAKEMPAGEEENFDHPSAIDTGKLVEHIDSLRRGVKIERPNYSMRTSEPYEKTTTIEPSKLIIVEGISANLPELRRDSDLTLFVAATIEKRLRRRINRDVERKGYDPERTMDLFMNVVEPNYLEHYAEHDYRTDIFIDANVDQLI